MDRVKKLEAQVLGYGIDDGVNPPETRNTALSCCCSSFTSSGMPAKLQTSGCRV